MRDMKRKSCQWHYLLWTNTAAAATTAATAPAAAVWASTTGWKVGWATRHAPARHPSCTCPATTMRGRRRERHATVHVRQWREACAEGTHDREEDGLGGVQDTRQGLKRAGDEHRIHCCWHRCSLLLASLTPTPSSPGGQAIWRGDATNLRPSSLACTLVPARASGR